jgi:hypothetical protein
MDRTLLEHTEFLKRRIEKLNSRGMQSSLTREQRNTIETEIRAALMALDHYRKALALERQAISEG